MKIIWWETLLVVLIPLLLVFLFCYYRLYLIPTPTPNSDWENIKRVLQTGDLLFVKYVSKHGKLIKICTGQEWSHVAFVHRRGDQISLIEVADYTGYDEPDVDHLSGLCIVPIEKWERLNKDRLAAFRQCTQPRPHNQDIEDLLNKHRNIHLDLDLYNWTCTLFDTKNKWRQKRNYYCSEFIAQFLQDLRMLNAEVDPSSYSPAKLTAITGYHKLHTFILSSINGPTND